MPLKPARRLPKRYSRRVSRHTKRIVRKRHRVRRGRKLFDGIKRTQRRLHRAVVTSRHALAWWLLLTFLLLLVGGTGIVLFSPLIEVREVKITRTSSRLDVEQVQSILAPMFQKHLLFLQPNEVTVLLREKITDIASVDVTKEYPSTLHVTVALDPLYARLNIRSPDDVDDLSGSGAVMTDFLTDQGVYISAPLAEEREQLPLITVVDWGVRPTPGDHLIQPDLLQRMEQMERALSDQFGQHTLSRTVFVRANEYHLNIDDGFTLWFDVRHTLEQQMLRYRTFLRSVDVGEVTQYIDLRLSDRVIYK